MATCITVRPSRASTSLGFVEVRGVPTSSPYLPWPSSGTNTSTNTGKNNQQSASVEVKHLGTNPATDLLCCYLWYKRNGFLRNQSTILSR